MLPISPQMKTCRDAESPLVSIVLPATQSPYDFDVEHSYLNLLLDVPWALSSFWDLINISTELIIYIDYFPIQID